jgi:hypothetical protein
LIRILCQRYIGEPGVLDASFFDEPVATGDRAKSYKPEAAAASVAYEPYDDVDSAPLLSRLGMHW